MKFSTQVLSLASTRTNLLDQGHQTPRLLLERDMDFSTLFTLYVNGEYDSFKSMKKSMNISSSVAESLVY
ncbi:AB hydrolase superfamily protein [Fusarium oxysporum f. sp. albedinis]|nr:AB hydrolase superfamily protein [Fusarium oxysporum f. sp. albedinis]